MVLCKLIFSWINCLDLSIKMVICKTFFYSIKKKLGVLESLDQPDFQFKTFNNLQSIRNQMTESNLRLLSIEYQKLLNSQHSRAHLSNTPITQCKLKLNKPKGYQIIHVQWDGHCLYNAIIEGIINRQHAIPSAWLTLNSLERGQYMKQTFTKLCNYGYQILPLYAGLREILTTQGNGTRTLFEETFHRIKNGKYRQVSERELCLETKILRFEYMMGFQTVR